MSLPNIVYAESRRHNTMDECCGTQSYDELTMTLWQYCIHKLESVVRLIDYVGVIIGYSAEYEQNATDDMKRRGLQLKLRLRKCTFQVIYFSSLLLLIRGALLSTYIYISIYPSLREILKSRITATHVCTERKDIPAEPGHQFHTWTRWQLLIYPALLLTLQLNTMTMQYLVISKSHYHLKSTQLAMSVHCAIDVYALLNLIS